MNVENENRREQRRREERIPISTSFSSELPTSPLPFNSPIIEECLVDYFDILTPSSSTTSSPSKIKGLCLISEKYLFQMEETTFKISLYGSIHRGWFLEQINLNEYKRPSISYQIVVKKFRKIDVLNLSRADDPLQEFAALQEIGNSHPNVLGQIACLQDENYYYSIMRFCDGGELCSQILGVGPIDENNARHLFLQLVDAIEFIQSKGIFHRDISLVNILITNSTTEQQQQQLILIDFGMCLKIPKHSDHPNQVCLLSSLPAKGKKSYMAPEIVSEVSFNGFQADIWSLGIVLFTMLTGKFIVTHASSLCQLFRHVRNGRLKEMCQHWKLGLSDNVQNLLFDMLSVDPKRRPTISEIRKYAWCLVNEEGSNCSAAGA